VKWGVGVCAEKASLAAERRSKAILATIKFTILLAKVTMGVTQGLLLKENGKILVSKV
jgi:hypothetical protein